MERLRYILRNGQKNRRLKEVLARDAVAKMFAFVDERLNYFFIKAGGVDNTDWINVEINCWSGSARQCLPLDESTFIVEKNPPFPSSRVNRFLKRDKGRVKFERKGQRLLRQ